MNNGCHQGHDPSHVRLLGYWNRKRAALAGAQPAGTQPAGALPGGALPGRDDIDPLDIPDLLPNLFLLTVTDRPEQFRVRLLGSEVAHIIGNDITGAEIPGLEALADEAHPAVLADYAACTTGVDPHFRWFEATWPGGPHYECSRLLLPLAADGKTVDMLMGLLRVHEISHQTEAA